MTSNSSMSVLVFSTLLLWIFINDAAYSWPEGSYGLPMPKTGCPVGPNIEWETGTRTQMTKKGSHPSDIIHLAGIEPSYAEHIVQLFCMKMAYPKEGDYTWMPGKYCIFKKEECPAKFQEGFIVWDDAVHWYNKNEHKQKYGGVLPDGEFDDNTKVIYCCRTDGSPYNPISLPHEAPFFLLKFGDVCQEVDHMMVNEEWVYWSDEGSSSVTRQGGIYPKVIRSQSPKVFTKLFYCYYQPKPPNQTLKILTFLLYGAGGLVGFSMLTSFVACIVKWLCRCRGDSKEGEWSGLGQDYSDPPQPVVVSGGSGESPRVYKYVTVRTTDGLAVGAGGGKVGLYSGEVFPEEGVAYPALFAENLSGTAGNHLITGPSPLVPTAPSEWDDSHQQRDGLSYNNDLLKAQLFKQPQLIQQPIVATRLVVLKPAVQSGQQQNLSYLPSYSDAMSVQKQ